ncbi:hypothetical protein NMG60_11004680 [Bertholletia excelsa]
MEASSHDHQHFPLDPVLPFKFPGFSEEPNNPTLFPQFYSPVPDCLNFGVPESSCLGCSSVVDKPAESGEQVTQKVAVVERKRKSRDGCSMSSARPKSGREEKGKKQKVVMREDEEKGRRGGKKDQKKDSEEAPTAFIHVRARRGQATDRHSLAERVRREKISERMRQLQALVPGCDKVTGKALMLDEIINYVQSLQHQVEFLSMKLASMNPMLYDFGMDLEALMATPERFDGLPTPMPSLQKGTHDQGTVFSGGTTTTTTPNIFALLDTSLQYQLLPDQDNGQVLWDVDEQRQKLINQSGFTNNLCSFH